MKKHAVTKSGADLAAAALAAAVLIAAAVNLIGLAPARLPARFSCVPSGHDCGVSIGGTVGCHGLAEMLLGGRLDLNRATVADLDLIPGIGRKTAGRIVAARNRAGRFASAEEALTAAKVRGASAAAIIKWTGTRP